jgi:hypothetical protein
LVEASRFLTVGMKRESADDGNIGRLQRPLHRVLEERFA